MCVYFKEGYSNARLEMEVGAGSTISLVIVRVRKHDISAIFRRETKCNTIL